MKKVFWTITVVLLATVSLLPVPKMKSGKYPFESIMEQSLYEELHAAETDLKHADDAEQESQAWARYHVAVKNLHEWSKERLRRNGPPVQPIGVRFPNGSGMEKTFSRCLPPGLEPGWLRQSLAPIPAIQDKGK